MKWSWKIARIAGIDIYIHATFFLLIYLVGITYWNEQGTLEAVISGVGFVLALFSCVILHEFAHTGRHDHQGMRTAQDSLDHVQLLATKTGKAKPVLEYGQG